MRKGGDGVGVPLYSGGVNPRKKITRATIVCLVQHFEDSQAVPVVTPTNITISQIKHAAMEVMQQRINAQFDTATELEPSLTNLYPGKLILPVGCFTNPLQSVRMKQNT